MTPVKIAFAPRYELLYRILTMLPRSQLNVTIAELKDVGLYYQGADLSRVAGDIQTHLGIRMTEYRIRVFKKHIRITRP